MGWFGNPTYNGICHDVERMTPTLARPVKPYYTEAEVAEQLGVSVDRLRSIIQEKIMTADDDARTALGVTFQPPDLLLLRLLVAQAGAGEPQG